MRLADGLDASEKNEGNGGKTSERSAVVVEVLIEEISSEFSLPRPIR